MCIVKCFQKWTNLICCAREATALATAESAATLGAAKTSTVSASFAKSGMTSFQSISMSLPAKCEQKKKRRRGSTPRRCSTTNQKSLQLQPLTQRMKRRRLSKSLLNNQNYLFNLISHSQLQLMKQKMRTKSRKKILNRMKLPPNYRFQFLKMTTTIVRKA